MNIVILAAGQGKRMKSSMPKVLHPIAGQAMLGHVLNSVGKVFNTLNDDESLQPCVVVGHGSEQVTAFLQKNFSEVKTALQLEQKGTGHAVAQAIPYLVDDQVTVILYGDVPLIQPKTLQGLMQLAKDGALAILTQEMVQPTGYGRIVRNIEGQVAAIVEEKDATPIQKEITEINTGILACDTADLKKWLGLLQPNNAQGEFYLTDIIASAAADGVPIRTCQAQFDWEVQGVNSREQLASLEREYQLHQAKLLLENGITLMDPLRIDLRGELICASDVVIDVGCIFEGRVEIAAGVQIGPYCVIKNAVIGANTTIHAFSHIDQAIVAQDVVIGPYARLRPGANIAEHAHIGNFVEVKNSQIGAGSKINHLSYIGDAIVGSNVNIGAGTITCNYDGVNKHQTIIEDDAFIGSDTQLVAPVKVGKGATLGAGTTLTKDAPADQLTVSRAKQISLAWKRPEKIKK